MTLALITGRLTNRDAEGLIERPLAIRFTRIGGGSMGTQSHAHVKNEILLVCDDFTVVYFLACVSFSVLTRRNGKNAGFSQLIKNIGRI